ncbi:MAG: SpoIIE family protein phosphatase [Acutalibacteraceae bacterium]
MSVNVQTKSKVKADKKTKTKKAILQYAVHFILGFLLGLSGFNKEFSPFGAAFVASVSPKFTIISSLGASVAWFITLDSVSALRYMSVVLALCVIKNSLKSFPRFSENELTPVITSFVCLLITGIAIVLAEEFSPISLLISFSESVIAGISAYLFTKTRKLLELKGGLKYLTSKEVIFLVVSFLILVLSIKNVNIYGVYLSHIVVSVLILICAFYGKESGGAIVGACGGVALSISTGNVFLLSFYAFGGLVSGLFSAFGKIASAVAFLVSGIAFGVLQYESIKPIPTLIEILVSIALYLVVTLKYNEKLSLILKPNITSPIINTVNNDVFKKLHTASEVSAEICASLNDVNNALEKSEKHNIRFVSQKTKERICGSCGLFDMCWGEYIDGTTDAFNTMLNMKKEGMSLNYKNVPAQFSSRCIRTENVSESFNRLYSEYKLHEKYDIKLHQINAAATQQFVNVSSLLNSLCENISNGKTYNMDIALRAKGSMASCGFMPVDSCCVIDDLDKLTLELKVKTAEKMNISDLSKDLELVTGRKLEIPIIEKEDGFTNITYKEKSVYKVVSACAQVTATGEKYSGDTFTTFTDSNGIFYAVLCDGMGTGTKAALTSGMAVTLLQKLIKAGFGIKSSVNTVNTSLISRSGEECSVTLDLVAIDTFSGFVRFFKCGSSETVVKKKNKLYHIGFSSLPLGIIEETEVSCGSGTLANGDVLVVTSDGVREEDRPILERKLKAFKGGNVKAFTEDLKTAIYENQEDKCDDISIITIALTDND